MQNSSKEAQITMANSASEPLCEHEEDELTALLAQCQLGNKQAFSLLYQKTAGRLNGVAYRITRHVDSANEVLQEAFIQIWQNRADYQAHKSAPFTWLASIVRYRAYDRLRYDKRRHQQDTVQFNEFDLLEQQLDDINQHSQTLGLGEHSEQALNNCLSQLEQKQSQSILMAYMFGYSREDIANHYDTPVNTIKSWIRRGLGRLRLCLSE
jgi:RNA polymerase sigma-70 factor (ECF subfamily)